METRLFNSTFTITDDDMVDDCFKDFTPEKLLEVMEKMKAEFPPKESLRDLFSLREPMPLSLIGYDKPLVDTGIMFRARYDFTPVFIERRLMYTVGLDEIFREIDELCWQLGISPEEFEDINLGDRSDDTDLECFAEVDTVMES